MAEGTLVMFGGPAGAGKTTLAARWCASRARAVHIQLDDVRSLIVSGLADSQSDAPEVGDQYALSVRACCALAKTFVSSGYDVAIDDVLEPDAVARYWRPALEDIEFSLVVIRPELDETLRRARSRLKQVREDIIRSQYEATLAWSADVCLDTTGLTVEESLAKAVERGLLP